jgi:peptide/nickel transport system substrate-binding protein
MAIALTSMLATGCQSAVQQADQQAQGGGQVSCQQGGTLVAVAAQPPIPGRVLAQGAANFFWVRGVFEPLMTTAGGSPQDPQPVLATDWTISEDDRTVVLRLREGVSFHSGRPFTAADVVFTIQQALDQASPSDVKAILGGWQVEATGEYEVTIRSQNPLSPVLGSTLDLTPIVDSETYAGVQDGSQLIGTGPYRVDSYQPGAQIVLVRNDRYWQPDQVVLDRIENIAIPDSTAQLSALRSGRAQLAFGMTTQDALSLTGGDPRFQIMETNGTVYPLVLDTTQGVFTDRTVRQAIGYAIDRQRINEQVLGGMGSTAGLYWSEADATYPADQANAYPYDPDRARQMIEAAGATGAEVPITIINNPVLQAEYEIIANNLTDVGLRPSVIALAAPDYQQRLSSGAGGNYLSFRGLNGTPAFMVQTNADLRLQGAHRTFTSPEYQQLVTGLVQAPAGDASNTAVADLTRYLNEQAVMQILAVSPGVAVRDGSVQQARFGLGGISWNGTCLAAP